MSIKKATMNDCILWREVINWRVRFHISMKEHEHEECKWYAGSLQSVTRAQKNTLMIPEFVASICW